MAETSAPRPALAWFVAFDGGIVALTVLALSPSAHAAAQARAPLPPRSALKGLLAVTAAVHVGEALAARRLAARHGLPVAHWTRQTFVVGFPSLLALRRTIRS
ncbi:MAG TPA: CRISPR-associated protein Cas5 [Iamia sp.]